MYADVYALKNENKIKRETRQELCQYIKGYFLPVPICFNKF